jgi:hypothetical protein
LSIATSAGREQITPAAGTGSLRGRVVVPSRPPQALLKVTVDDKICGLSIPDDSLVVDEKGGVAHAIVTVVGLAWPAAGQPARVTNKGCRFVPHVQASRPGVSLEITSEDNTLHTTHAYGPDERSLFNVALPLPGLTITRPLDRVAGAVRFACDTHPWMRGFVLVSADRAVATGADGSFQVTDIPAGSYEVTVWHERLRGPAQRVAITAGQTSDTTFTLTDAK